MNGELTPEEQLRVLGKIWGADRDGYVFLPYIDGSARTVERRRKSYHEGRAYEWPKDKQSILAHLREHGGDDVYFTPALFNAKRRTEQNVDAERTLWADLDPVDPSTLGEYRPTIAWESSPGRFQGVWLLDRPKVGASWASQENHRLSLHLGADPSGWDSTQLLRVPGRPNHKPAYGEPVAGRLLWDNGPRYQWSDFADLPEVGVVAGEDIDLLDEDLIGSVDRHALWATVRLRVSKQCREYMASRDSGGADRSDVLWQIERDLADAGCSVLEIIALVRPTVWNKYAGRADELKRLKTEAAKAIAAREEQPIEAADDSAEKPGIQWLAGLVNLAIPRPRWLVDDLWTQGGCGFISGQPKSYKSWLAIDLAVAVSTGTPFLGLPQHGVRRVRPVLYVQEEDDFRLVMSRLSNVVEAKAPRLYWRGQLSVAASDSHPPTPGVTKGRRPRTSVRITWGPPEGDIPLAVHVQSGFVASDPGWQAWLGEVVASGRFGLVIIDTLGTTAGDVDTDRSADLMPKILKPLKTVAKVNDTAVCLVHHNRKSQADARSSRAGQDMLGSVALHAWVDCAIYARSREGGEVQLEREAKQAPELSMRIRIPQMFESTRTGARQLWEPETVMVTDDGSPPPDRPERPAAERPVRGAGALKAKLRGCGLKPGRRYQAERLAAFTEAEIRRLVDSGELREYPDTAEYEWMEK